jgi:hypothetical protein
VSSYKEMIKGARSKRRGWKKWAKRQMSKLRRRWKKDEVPPKTNKLTDGYY